SVESGASPVRTSWARILRRFAPQNDRGAGALPHEDNAIGLAGLEVGAEVGAAGGFLLQQAVEEAAARFEEHGKLVAAALDTLGALGRVGSHFFQLELVVEDGRIDQPAHFDGGAGTEASLTLGADVALAARGIEVRRSTVRVQPFAL